MLIFRIVHSCANFLGLCTAVLIFGQNYEVTLFCREFQYWRIYAFSVLILGVKKWACAIFYTFCMSDHIMGLSCFRAISGMGLGLDGISVRGYSMSIALRC